MDIGWKKGGGNREMEKRIGFGGFAMNVESFMF